MMIFQVLKNSRNIKNTNSRGKSQYISKVKCSTLQTPSNYPGSENKIMLGLKDLNDEDSFCEYEKKSVHLKQNLIPNKKKIKENNLKYYQQTDDDDNGSVK